MYKHACRVGNAFAHVIHCQGGHTGTSERLHLHPSLTSKPTQAIDDLKVSMGKGRHIKPSVVGIPWSGAAHSGGTPGPLVVHLVAQHCKHPPSWHCTTECGEVAMAPLHRHTMIYSKQATAW